MAVKIIRAKPIAARAAAGTVAAITAALILILAACQFPTSSSKSTAASAGSSSSSATLAVSWKLPAASKTIMPTSSETGLVAPSSYDLTFTASGQATVTKTGVSSSRLSVSLACTTWSVYVNGRDSSGNVVASGTGSVTVSSGGDNALAVSLSYIVTGTGTGGVNVSLTWPSPEPVSAAAISLVSSSGATLDTSSAWTVNIGTGSASLALSGIVVGSYTATLTLKDSSGTTLYGRQETIVVFQNMTTAGTISVAESDFSIPVTSISLSATSLSLSYGGTRVILVATVNPSNASDLVVNWSSDSPAIATVDPTSGAVTPVYHGTATITATSDDGKQTATCEVTVSGS
jgi:hypothetical protein